MAKAKKVKAVEEVKEVALPKQFSRDGNKYYPTYTRGEYKMRIVVGNKESKFLAFMKDALGELPFYQGKKFLRLELKVSDLEGLIKMANKVKELDGSGAGNSIVVDASSMF